MGNHASRTLPVPLSTRNPAAKAARVILPCGEIRHFRWEHVRAADLMLECPNFFLTDAESLHVGKRFSALSADEELEFGHMYVMFPMRSVNSVVTAYDVISRFMSGNSGARKISRVGVVKNVRVSPESGASDGGDGERKRERLDCHGGDDENNMTENYRNVDFPAPEFSYRLGSCRSRKPRLETIKEESDRSMRENKQKKR